MADPGFTPGPWIADNDEGYSSWGIWSRMTPSGNGTPGPLIATVVGDSAETDANAHLIAASLAMYGALKEALWALDNVAAIMAAKGLESTLNDPRPAIRAALSSAEGREPGQ